MTPAGSTRIAAESGGHYLDQFTFAERATDWRGNNNIAESIFEQMDLERHPTPKWIVVGAGTGGTSATIGRYVRYRRLSTQLCVVDPEDSVFANYFRLGDPSLTGDRPSRIEVSAVREWSRALSVRSSTGCSVSPTRHRWRQCS